MAAWGVQSLQAVWWGLKPPTVSAQDIYQTMIGSGPPAVQTNPALGLAAAIGTDGLSVFRIQVQQTRVDFFENSQSQGGQTFPLFSDLKSTMQRFRQRLASASGIVGDAARLALVVNTSEEAASAEEATNLLVSKLGITLPFQDGSELIFQINRKRPLASMPGQEINLIMKWLVENVQQITISSGAPIVQATVLKTLSVDVNTVPSTRVFTPAEQPAIFQEIFDEAERLSQVNALSALS